MAMGIGLVTGLGMGTGRRRCQENSGELLPCGPLEISPTLPCTVLGACLPHLAIPPKPPWGEPSFGHLGQAVLSPSLLPNRQHGPLPDPQLHPVPVMPVEHVQKL